MPRSGTITSGFDPGVLRMSVPFPLMPGGLLPFVYGLFTLVACYFIIEWNSKHLHFGIARLRGAKRKAVFCLIWALTIAVVLYAMPRIETFATPGNNYLLP